MTNPNQGRDNQAEDRGYKGQKPQDNQVEDRGNNGRRPMTNPNQDRQDQRERSYPGRENTNPNARPSEDSRRPVNSRPTEREEEQRGRGLKIDERQRDTNQNTTRGRQVEFDREPTRGPVGNPQEDSRPKQGFDSRRDRDDRNVYDNNRRPNQTQQDEQRGKSSQPQQERRYEVTPGHSADENYGEPSTNNGTGGSSNSKRKGKGQTNNDSNAAPSKGKKPATRGFNPSGR
jgi:hypothetical protein